MLKKLTILGLALILLGACSNEKSSSIKVYTRDGASGAREAFSSIIKLDTMSASAAETTGNGDMAKQVGLTQNGIGYVSLSTDFKSHKLKPLSYEGVAPSVQSVTEQEYQLARPFSYVTRNANDYDSPRKADLIAAFIDYMTLSTEGREVILSSGGIVDVRGGVAWRDLKEKHPIVDEYNGDIIITSGGSTSVKPTLDALMESFMPQAGGFKYQPNHTGSSDGYKRTLGSEKDSINKIDIGFASREFKAEEDTSNALFSGVYCLDAVVVVVYEGNDYIDNADAELLRKIFSGEIVSWKEV